MVVVVVVAVVAPVLTLYLDKNRHHARNSSFPDERTRGDTKQDPGYVLATF